MMKNNDSFQNQRISWNEYEVVECNCSIDGGFENRARKKKAGDFQVQDHNTSEGELDTEQILYYMYKEDLLSQMDEFRVKRINERFGFSVENPSDAIYQEHASR